MNGAAATVVLEETRKTFAGPDGGTVAAVDGIRRLRFTSPYPTEFTPRVIEAMAELPAVCEHVHLPVQSGADSVLKRMLRRYRRADYLEVVARLRAAIPDITFSTDIIVGFPGETEEQFEHTLEVLREAQCDKVHVAMYSPRPGTLSARWEDDIPHEEKLRRHQALEKQQEAICTERNARRLGETVEVLVDQKAKGRWTGRTRGNQLVHFEDDRDLLGKMIDVKITRTSPLYFMSHAASEPR